MAEMVMILLEPVNMILQMTYWMVVQEMIHYGDIKEMTS